METMTSYTDERRYACLQSGAHSAYDISRPCSRCELSQCVQHGGRVWLTPFLCDESYEIASGMSDPCWRRDIDAVREGVNA